MKTFKIPPSCLIKQNPVNGITPEPVPLPFVRYLDDIILTLPYWRSTEEAATQAEEILEQIDSESESFVLKDSTIEALVSQMKLAESSIVTLNPKLVRPSLRYLRVVNSASKFVEP